jgi:hypothetical protein
MPRKDPIDLKSMDRAFFEGLDASERLELLCRLHAMTVEMAEEIWVRTCKSKRGHFDSWNLSCSMSTNAVQIYCH